MDPNRNETIGSLIARRPERLNILITKVGIAPVSGAAPGNGVVVRYGYMALTDAEMHEVGRPTGISVPTLGERWDAEAINTLGRPGAYVNVPDVAGIHRAVEQLRAVWGPLHVQDNSGAVPELDQGLFQG